MTLKALVGAMLLVGALSVSAAVADPFYSIESKAPQTIESFYSPRICNVLKSWPPADIPAAPESGNPLWMRGVRKAGDDSYVGVEKRMLIHAPLAKVTALMKDFDHYKDRITDLKKVEVLSHDGNRLVTKWETKSPVFFVPNTKYELVWTIDESQASRAVFRFQLRQSNHLKASDTLIVLEAKGDATLLTTFDFFQLDLGVVGAFATVKKVWTKSFEGLYHGDIALKAQLEHPDWSARQIDKEAERLLDQNPVDHLEYTSNEAFTAETPVAKVSAAAVPAPKSM